MATQLEVYRRVAALVGQPRFATVSDDVELRYLLDDEYDAAVNHCLTAVPWRFSTIDRSVADGGTAQSISGFDHIHDIPANVLRVVAVFVDPGSDPREVDFPIDCRISDGAIHSQYSSIRIRAITTAGQDETLWPDMFTNVVASYLAFIATQRISALNGRTDDLYGLFQRTLGQAAERYAGPESPWFVAQISGAFASSARYVLGQGAWRFALVTNTLSVSANPPSAPGFANRFDSPSDVSHYHSIYYLDTTRDRLLPVDVRDLPDRLVANVSLLRVQYVSTDVLLTPEIWPEAFLRAVGAHLGLDFGDMPVRQSADGGVVERPAVWPDYLQQALARYAVEDDPWYRHQISGAFAASTRYVLSQGPWRFALTTDEPTASTSGAPGFAYKYTIPADCVRLHSVYRTDNESRELPVDVRQDGNVLSARITGLAIRYISSDALDDPADWPDEFVRTVSAHLGIDRGDTPVRQASDGSVVEQTPVWPEYLRQALVTQGVAENPWFAHQISGAFASSIHYILSQGPWRFALATSVLTSTTPGAPGFTYKYSLPSDCVRLHSVFLTDTLSRELPVDVRQDGSLLSARVTGLSARYISSDALDDPADWPNEFLRTVSAHLGIDRGDVPARRAADGSVVEQTPVWPEYLRQGLATQGVAESPWFAHQISGAFAASVRYILSQGPWRFALVTDEPTASATGAPGFAYKYTIPTDCVRLHSVYLTDDTSRELPVDIRQDGTVLSARATGLAIRYITTDVLDTPAEWPDEFLRTVSAHLGVNRGDVPARQSADGSVVEQTPVWPEYLRQALATQGVAESPWFAHQISGAFAESSHYILSQGPWRFALTTDEPTATTPGAPGFAYKYGLPADCARLHSVFVVDTANRERPVDIRQDGNILSAPVDDVVLRYISDDVLADTTLWPNEFLRVVSAHLGINRGDIPVRRAGDGSVAEQPAVWPDYLKQALTTQGIAEDPWLRFQLDGTFAEAARHLMFDQDWKWAAVTVRLTGTENAIGDLLYRFAKPANWAATVEALDIYGEQVEYREEGTYLYSTVEEIDLRYLKSGLSAADWPEYYDEVLMAYLTYMEAVSTQGTPGAVVNARRAAYDAARRDARLKDDRRERPKMNRTSALTQARRGYYSTREDG